jgi:molybdopterin converting factor small subunit
MRPAVQSRVKVDVLLFGAAAQAAGADRVPVVLERAGAAKDVLAALAVQHPGLARMLSSARLAVNYSFAAADMPIGEGDEVALIAMVGGG